MILQCPKCKRTFTILDSVEQLRQTCMNEKCKVLIQIKRLALDEVRNLSLYEVTQVIEDKKDKQLELRDIE